MKKFHKPSEMMEKFCLVISLTYLNRLNTGKGDIYNSVIFQSAK
jgi:hypothetical protein